MGMTHYMELLATNQPWNLIIFMAIPVILVEALTGIEFFIAFRRLTTGSLKTISKFLGITVGIYFTGIFFYMVTTVIPTIEWRGLVDLIAVWSYLSGVLPLGAITLLELGVIAKNKSEEEKIKLHFIFLTIFLVVAHIAMIFGMVNPDIFQPTTNPIPGMNHSHM